MALLGSVSRSNKESSSGIVGNANDRGSLVDMPQARDSF